MAVIFPILSTFDAAGVNKAQRAFKGLGGVSKTATIAFAALGAAATKFGVDAVKAAAADQQAQLKLAKTLENVTGATDAAIKATEQFITAQQFATGVSDNQLRPALETLVRATGDVTKAQNLLKLGLDVSAGSGRDLESISLALAKAQGGQFTALQRLGIVIPDNIKKSKDFAKVQEYLNQLFGGQAAVAANTFAGKLAIMRERLGEAQETIGSLLIPILTKLVDQFLNNVMPAIERVVQVIQFQGAGAGLKQVTVEISNVITNLNGTAKAVKDLILAFLGIKIVIPLVAALRASWIAVQAAIGATATATAVAAGVMKSALISTGIGALIVAAGILVGKLIEMRIEANATDKTVRFMESNGVNAFRNMSQAADMMNGKIKNNIVSLNAVALAASRAADELDNAGIKRVKQGRVPPVAVAVPGANEGLGSAAASANKATKAVTGLSDAAKVAQSQMAKLGDELTRNNDILAKAKDAYASFKSGIVSVITGIIDFGQAATAETGTFLENLVAQAAKAQDFGNKVKQLLAMGLSETAISQVLAAGADAGTKIADEIIAGGATVVNQINTLVSATQSVADAVGESAAAQFYTAGITAGESLVAGVKAAIASAGFTINADGTIINQAGINQVNAAIAAARGKKSKGKTKITKGERQAIMDLAASLGVEVPAFAKGGIVTGPTLALIGEAGPEAVVPLSGRNAGMGNTFNLTVNAGLGADGAVIGREIVDAIKRYERASGPVFASA
jgi:hypothetical protein